MCKIRLMCGFILKEGGEGAVANKIQSDAKEALNNIEKAEKEVEKKLEEI